jgi:hypothetical protein
MKILFMLSSIVVNCVQQKNNIKNLNVPSCKNCVHFMPCHYNEFTYSYNKCNKFGSKNIISDQISYDFVSSCRDDENKCGQEGKYFCQEQNIDLKILKHAILYKMPWLIFIFTTGLGLFFSWSLKQ